VAVLVWVAANAVLQTALALAAALILHQKFPGVRVARTWIVLSWIVPTVVVVMIWRWLFSTSGGMVNPALVGLGVTDRPGGLLRDAPGPPSPRSSSSIPGAGSPSSR
jgi:multiple sugar transport system permease protein